MLAYVEIVSALPTFYVNVTKFGRLSADSSGIYLVKVNNRNTRTR